MVDWGSVPAYFGGLALVLTVIVLLRDRREKIRSQANQIAAWVQRSRDDSELHRVVVRNASDLPCHNVVVWMSAGYRDPSRLRFSKTWGVNADRPVKPRYEHAVGPGETLVVFETDLEVAVRTLVFTDAAGRRWERQGTTLSHGKARRKLRIRTRFRRVYLKVAAWNEIRKVRRTEITTPEPTQ